MSEHNSEAAEDYVCDFCREVNEKHLCDGAPYFTCEICSRESCDSHVIEEMWKPGQRATDDPTDICIDCVPVAKARGFRDAGDLELFEGEMASDWQSDLSVHLREQLEALFAYLGVECEDGRLAEIAGNAVIEVIGPEMLRDSRAGRVRRVLPIGDRPAFCFWTPTRQLVADEERA